MMRTFLLRVLLLPALWLAGVATAAPDLLSPEAAFRFSARVIGPQAVEVRYQIARGYYLYRERTKFNVTSGEVKLGDAQFPKGETKTDKYFGTMETYRGDLRIVLPVSADTLPASFTLNAESQGCADIGVCYAPQEHQAKLTLTASSASSSFNDGIAFFNNAGSSTQSEDSRIAALFQGGFWWLLASFFGFGLLLAFTPCMFPMIPILSGILVPHGQRLTKTRGFLLSLAYVLGMALTYAVIGVAAGLLGTLLSSALQNPWVLGAFALVFVALALSMFGLYELQLPAAFQSAVSVESNKLHGGHFIGVFTMGVLSALIVGPCVAAPLAGALLYISQSGDVLLGGSALFVMALGMGAPLLVVGASSGALLPRSGAWMDNVKKIFGVILLGVAIYLVSPVIPAPVVLGLWAALLIVSAIFLHALDALPVNASGWRKLWKGVGILFLLAGVIELAGALSGGRNVLQPLAGLRAASAGAPAIVAPFQRIASNAELDQRVKTAGRPVMFDFYADWCVTCKEMEHDTFTDPRVRARFERMLLLQADVTANLDEHKALLKRFELFGPPGIVFFDAQGKQIPGLRIVGFQSPDEFLHTLDQVLRDVR